MRARILLELTEGVRLSALVTTMTLLGCAGAAPPPPRLPDFRAVEWQAAQRGYDEAMHVYESTGEAPLLGSEPDCMEYNARCVSARAEWQGRRNAQRYLFDRVLQCEGGQDQCSKVRSSETDMRKLVHRHWQNGREEKARAAAEIAAGETERLRAEEEVRLREWREMQVEEAAAAQAARDREAAQAAMVQPPAPPIQRAPRDWQADAEKLVRGLRSNRVACSWAFGETEYADRVEALEALETIGRGDAEQIGRIVDESHGAGQFQRMVDEAEGAVRAFIPRRCVAGL